MEIKLNLDVHAILDKEFHVDFKGYSASEVDALLDLVIEDYQIYDQMIAKMSETALIQERTIASLKAKVLELESKQKMLSESENLNSSQMDILKRLSRLEQIVYQEKK